MVLGISLERNILIRNFRPGAAAGSAAEFFGMATRLNLFSAARSATACTTGSRSGSSGIAAPAEHAEVVGHNLKAGALLAFLVLPFAGLDAALDEHQRTLLQILLRDFGLLAPDDNFVPLGALLALAVAVLVGLVRGDGKIGGEAKKRGTG